MMMIIINDDNTYTNTDTDTDADTDIDTNNNTNINTNINDNTDNRYDNDDNWMMISSWGTFSLLFLMRTALYDVRRAW